MTGIQTFPSALPFLAFLGLLRLLLLCLLSELSECATTRDTLHKQHLYSTSVDETTNLLLSYRDDPLARHDKWSMLSDTQRKKWTQANNLISSNQKIADLMDTTNIIREPSFHVHVLVQIISPPNFISPGHRALISRYSAAMRAGCNGTLLNLTVSLAPEKIYQRVHLHYDDIANDQDHQLIQKTDQLSAFLTQSALSLPFLNVLYVIIHPQKATSTSASIIKPVLSTSRMSFFQYDTDSPSSLSVAHLLSTVERIAERVFSPNPLYFPVPLLPDMEVSVTAYTPSHELRASWLYDFAWDDFETAVRSFALPGQKVRFSSSQTNAECPSCKRAFKEIRNPSVNFIRNAVMSLSHDVMPNASWATTRYDVHHVPNALHKQTTARHTFRLFVLDTVNVRQTEALQRLERRALFTFPGTAVLVIRSSDRNVKLTLHPNMLHGFAACVYSVVDPAFYIPSTQSLSGTATILSESPWPGKQSPVLKDIVIRNTVRSVLERRLGQLEEIVDGMVYFEVEPSKSLDEDQFKRFVQRVNLMLFKLRRAQDAISESHDGQLALYLASSTEHDMKSIRAVLDIDDEKRMMKRFRDPTIRCHFSRLKREAIRASEIIETSYPSAKLVLLAAGSFSLSYMATRALIWRLRIGKPLRKTV